MEALIARLSPALDLDSLLDDPAMPIDAGESKPDSPAASTPSSRSRMPDVIPPPTIFLPGSSRHPASNDATTLADTHAPCMQAANGSRLRQASVDYDSLEDDTLFIGSKLAATTLDCGDAPNTHPAPPAHVASQPERLVEAVVRAPHADPPDNWSYKYIGRASTLHALQHIKRLSRRSFQELGVHPQQVRPQYWTDQNHIPQAASLPKSCANAWPAPDLASILLDAYFARLNRDFPIVNESQFRHEYARSHHTSSDNGWLALAYCIFMVGSLYVDDERARADPENEHSRGMQWWQNAKELLYGCESLQKPLVRIQCLLLSTLFQLNRPFPTSLAWDHLGSAIRLLQDVGAHRRQMAKRVALPLIEAESFKRVFWVAYSLDRELASSLGRPLMLQDEDLDVELPLLVDDEGLLLRAKASLLPHQSTAEPALIGGFVCSLQLDKIIGLIHKTTYALNKPKSRPGSTSIESDRRKAEQLDSLLNAWLQSVPSHLTYDPEESTDEWLIQSTLLHCKYYSCQLLLHRAFITESGATDGYPAVEFPSLAICTNAARSIVHIVEVTKARDRLDNLGILGVNALISACNILLIVAWGTRCHGARVADSAVNDLSGAIELLRCMEERWHFCGKAVDIYESMVIAVTRDMPQIGRPHAHAKERSRHGSRPLNVDRQGSSWGDTSHPSSTSEVASRDMIDHQGGGHDTAQGSSQTQTFADVWCIAGPSATSRPDETGDATTAVNVQDASIPDADVQDGASDRQPVSGPPTFDEYAFGYFQPWPEAAPADCDDFLRQEWSEMEVLDAVVRSVDRPREQSLHMDDDFLDWLQRLH